MKKKLTCEVNEDHPGAGAVEGERNIRNIKNQMISRPDPQISLKLSHHQLWGSFVLLEDLSESVTRVGANQPPVTAEWQESNTEMKRNLASHYVREEDPSSSAVL